MRQQRQLAGGVVGGILGALAMSSVRALLVEWGTISEPLPHKVERRIARAIGIADKISGRQEDLLAHGQHLMMGATFGAGYPLFHRILTADPVVNGSLYGLAVYAVNLMGLGPAFDITRPPWSNRLDEVARQITIHVIYGIVTAVVVEKLSGE